MAAELTLHPVAVRGRFGGFRNLLRNELAAFWGTPTWLIQVGTWLVFGPGFLLLFLLTESLGAGQDGRAPRAAIELAARVLPATAGTLVAIAAVILAQGKIVGEKQSGTACVGWFAHLCARDAALCHSPVRVVQPAEHRHCAHPPAGLGLR